MSPDISLRIHWFVYRLALLLEDKLNKGTNLPVSLWHLLHLEDCLEHSQSSKNVGGMNE